MDYTAQHSPLFAVNGKTIPANAYWDLLGGLRGPDIDQLPKLVYADGFDYGATTEAIVKSVTSLLVRRAIFGVEIAERRSSPSKPNYEGFHGLSKAELRKALPQHYTSHMYKALSVLDRYILLPPEDQRMVHDIRVRLSEVWW